MIKLVMKILPSWIRRKIHRFILNRLKEVNEIKFSQIPQHKIRQQTIKNTKLLLNREELLKILPKQGVIAELGVDEGNFSKLILKVCDPKKLHLVDVWETKRYNQNKRRLVEDKFKSQISSGKVEINIGYSTEVGRKFQNNYFDWIYIDTDHSYKTTIQELEIWKSKVKDNGIIAGHDYLLEIGTI